MFLKKNKVHQGLLAPTWKELLTSPCALLCAGAALGAILGAIGSRPQPQHTGAVPAQFAACWAIMLLLSNCTGSVKRVWPLPLAEPQPQPPQPYPAATRKAVPVADASYTLSGLQCLLCNQRRPASVAKGKVTICTAFEVMYFLHSI